MISCTNLQDSASTFLLSLEVVSLAQLATSEKLETLWARTLPVPTTFCHKQYGKPTSPKEHAITIVLQNLLLYCNMLRLALSGILPWKMCLVAG